MAVCDQCLVELPPENDFVTCSGCNSKLHYNCANVRETVWRRYSAQVKLAWKCAICKVKTTSTDNSKSTESKLEGANGNGIDNVSKANCTVLTENEYFRELLRHKDMIIGNQADLIVSLKEQINLMKTHRAYNSVASHNNKGGAALQKIDLRKSAPVVPSNKAEISHSIRELKASLTNDGVCSDSEELLRQSTLGNTAPASISNYDMLEAMTRNKMDHFVNLAGEPDGGTQVKKLRIRRPNQTIVGKRSTNDETGLRAADTYSYWHVYHLHPQTKKEDVEAYLQKEFPGVQVEKLDSSNPTIYSSFKVVIKESDEQRILDPGLWPNGTRINRFFLPRRR